MDPKSYFCCHPNGNFHEQIPLFLTLAKLESTVLIQGPTGSGKEYMARFLHQHSPRNNKPFIALNCGALSETLLESELFGCSRGAFTGAWQDRKGKLAAANGGTLFLDEIAELPLNMQAKLLRVLQEKSFFPLGSTSEERSDFRLICASHKDLQLAVCQNVFREDLFYRICVYPLYLSSLEDRREDIPLLAQKIWRNIAPCLPELNEKEINMLQYRPWPGNIRELHNELERLRILKHLPNTAIIQQERPTKQYENREEKRKEKIHKIMQLCENNRSKAARTLGISRGSLNYQLKKMGYSLEEKANLKQMTAA